MLAAACHPSAADDYVAREKTSANVSRGPSAPLLSPDTTDAVWVGPPGAARLLFGLPGQVPLLALECVRDGRDNAIVITRYAPADPHAKAFLALVGNGHRASIPVDAVRRERTWLWEGVLPADSRKLEGWRGTGEPYVTVPGAGRIAMPASEAPGGLIDRCRENVSAPR